MTIAAPHPNGNPHGDFVPLAPPTLMRTRVVAPERVFASEGLIDSTVKAIEAAVKDSSPTSGLVEGWTEKILELQRSGRLPSGNADRIRMYVAFGIAAAQLERQWGWMQDGQTAELTHMALTIVVADDTDAGWLLNAVAVDGGYYVTRSGIAAGDLATSMAHGAT